MTNETKISAAPISSAPKKRKKRASLEKTKSRAGWMFVMPFIVGLVLIYLPIIFNSILSTFQSSRIDVNANTIKEFVGWQNYKNVIMGDVDFAQKLWEGLGNMVFEIPAIVIFSLFMAVLLNQKMVGRAAFRAIFFIPVIISTGLMESLKPPVEDEGIDPGDDATDTATQLVNAIDIARLFENMKIGTGLVEYVTEMVNSIYDIVNRSGVQMLIFLSGLQSISPAIYESCSIDGASGWETFWKITFPMISPMILVNGVYTIIDSFTTDSNVVMSYIQSNKTLSDEVGTTMAWIYFMIVILIVAAIAGLFSAFVFYQRRD